MKTTLTKVLIVVLLMSQIVVGIGVAEAAPAESSCTYYTVRWGDTLYSIARRYGTTVQAIAQANQIYNPSLIHAGQDRKSVV